MKNIPQAYRTFFGGGFRNFCRYYARSQTGKSTGYRPTLKPLIILIKVNCCIRFICDIVGTGCSLEWFNSAETRSLFSNNFMSGRGGTGAKTAEIRLGSSGSSTMFWAMPTLSSNRNVTIFLRSSVMYMYLFSVLTGLADHLPLTELADHLTFTELADHLPLTGLADHLPVFLLKLLWYLLWENKAIC